jgi:hypothetical protein
MTFYRTELTVSLYIEADCMDAAQQLAAGKISSISTLGFDIGGPKAVAIAVYQTLKPIGENPPSYVPIERI